MLKLHRAGHIQLPPRRHSPPNNAILHRRLKEAPSCATLPIEGSVASLEPLKIRLVRRAQGESLFAHLLERYHYLGYSRPVGEHLKYLILSKDRPIACLAWGSAPRQLNLRDEFLGAPKASYQHNLHLIAYNTGYELERLRCDACGKVSTAPVPEEAGTQKYDPSVGVIVGLLRYGSGMPLYRLAKLQESLGVPMPASTQWEVMKPLFGQAQPVFNELVDQAANASLIHHDDTPMRILDLRRPGSATAAQIDPKRKGTFTTNILAYVQDRPVALYFTGWQHAGENLAQVLQHRAPGLEPPIQMCDALSRIRIEIVIWILDV